MVGRASPRSLPIRLLTSPHDAIISNRWRSPQANFNTRCDGTASSWSDDNWCEWLSAGFAAIHEGHPTAHLAFPPLRLYPIGRLVEQLATAFAEAANFGSPMR